MHVGQLALDRLTMREAVHQICSMALTNDGKAKIVATANAQFAQIARSDRRFHNILNDAEMVVADGMSIVAGSWLLGDCVPERIAGVDLVVELCREAAATGLSVYLLGGRPSAALTAAKHLSARFAGLRVAGTDCPRPGFENHPAESAEVVQRISETAPAILLVALGAPKQEYWMKEHADTLPVNVMVGVGGSFDVLSGEIPRAPRWMQKVGLEWAFRLAQEPRRLWRRYLVGNASFIWAVFGQALARKSGFGPSKIHL